MKSDVNNRGFALVATRQIGRGEVIYIERAAIASQIPNFCLACFSRNENHDTNDNSGESKSCQSLVAENMLGPSRIGCKCYNVRACQHCFRSLEPVSSITCDNTLNPLEASEKPAFHSKSSSALPLPSLWSVPEYQGRNWTITRDVFSICHYERCFAVEEGAGRIVCQQCNALFCSKSCFDAHCNEMGTCCLCSAVVQTMVHETCCCQEEGEEKGTIQPPLILAARMFCAAVFKHRLQEHPPADDLFAGMCGSECDITPLELGVLHQQQRGQQFYSLKEAHAALSLVLSLSNEEKKNYFSLSFLHRLAAIAARNGFAVASKNPFSTYYSDLIRVAGGRNTARHKNYMKEVSLALGSKDGTLQRGMDDEVENRCMAKMVAMFTLTARINHSCDPCAEVRGQQFSDCQIDLIARRDISVGEEITISYINIGRNAGRSASDRQRRMRELKARYLFLCDCSRCSVRTK